VAGRTRGRTRLVAARHVLEMQARVREVRKFERFYSRRLQDASRSLRIHEGKVAALAILEELTGGGASAAWLCGRLKLDAAYMSRTLKAMEMHKDVTSTPSKRDGRMRQIELTQSGLRTARFFEREHENRIARILEELPLKQQKRLVRAMQAIQEIFQRDALTNLLERCRENEGSDDALSGG
jgi:DNA-binding MarR family transcriptional regulator